MKEDQEDIVEAAKCLAKVRSELAQLAESSKALRLEEQELLQRISGRAHKVRMYHGKETAASVAVRLAETGELTARRLIEETGCSNGYAYVLMTRTRAALARNDHSDTRVKP